MKVLILGGGGMLGHKLVQVFQPHLETWATTTDNGSNLMAFSGIPSQNLVTDFDALDSLAATRALEKVQPDVVINAIGVVKQSSNMSNHELAIALNSLLPHRLASDSISLNFRLIHISTDCVFLGTQGMYREDSVPDATDLYGRSKLLGETDLNRALVLRTSLIGHELRHRLGLLEWFLAQNQSVHGYSHAYFSGLPTVILAKTILRLVTDFTTLEGIFHVASSRISKFDLLRLVNDRYRAEKSIHSVAQPHLDRSLDQSKFFAETGIEFPSWSDLVDEMARDALSSREWSI